MKTLRTINFVLVTLLAITAAIPKMMQMSHEVEAFSHIGLDATAVLVFGLLQFGGGILLLFSATRLWGAILTSVVFLGSTALLFLLGNIIFACLSLVPVMMTEFVVFEQVARIRAVNRQTQEEDLIA